MFNVSNNLIFHFQKSNQLGIQLKAKGQLETLDPTLSDWNFKMKSLSLIIMRNNDSQTVGFIFQFKKTEQNKISNQKTKLQTQTLNGKTRNIESVE